MAAGVVVLGVAGLAGCGSDDDDGGGGGATTAAGGGAAAQAPEDTSFALQIGNLVPLTGDLSPFGPPGRKAADLAVQQINDAAREAGIEATASVENSDTESNPQAAVQAARQLISGGARCMAGPWASSETIAVAESVAARQRTPIVSPSSTDAGITELEDDGFVYRTAPSDILQARALAQVVGRELGTDAVVSLAARNDAYGQGFIDRFGAAWNDMNGRSNGPVLYDPEQPSYNSEAGEIVSGSPDAFVIIDFFETYGKMGAALVRTGDFDAARLFTADGLASDRVPDTIPLRALAGARGTRPGIPESGDVVREFGRIYAAAGGAPRQTFDAQNFDATMLCFLAALAAGSDDGEAIAEQMQAVSSPPGRTFTFMNLADGIRMIAEGEEVDFDGVTGPIDFDDNGDPSTATYEVYRYDPQGVLRVEDYFQARER